MVRNVTGEKFRQTKAVNSDEVMSREKKVKMSRKGNHQPQSVNSARLPLRENENEECHGRETSPNIGG